MITSIDSTVFSETSVGERAALLIGDGLAIDIKRYFSVFPERVKRPIGIGAMLGLQRQVRAETVIAAVTGSAWVAMADRSGQLARFQYQPAILPVPLAYNLHPNMVADPVLPPSGRVPIGVESRSSMAKKVFCFI